MKSKSETTYKQSQGVIKLSSLKPQSVHFKHSINNETRPSTFSHLFIVQLVYRDVQAAPSPVTV